jgi:hypothetical protein
VQVSTKRIAEIIRDSDISDGAKEELGLDFAEYFVEMSRTFDPVPFLETVNNED